MIHEVYVDIEPWGHHQCIRLSHQTKIKFFFFFSYGDMSAFVSLIYKKRIRRYEDTRRLAMNPKTISYISLLLVPSTNVTTLCVVCYSHTSIPLEVQNSNKSPGRATTWYLFYISLLLLCSFFFPSCDCDYSVVYYT